MTTVKTSSVKVNYNGTVKTLKTVAQYNRFKREVTRDIINLQAKREEEIKELNLKDKIEYQRNYNNKKRDLENVYDKLALNHYQIIDLLNGEGDLQTLYI
ncbi:hypothetical protein SARAHDANIELLE_76 [Hafnia phage vB_HpaM_SarahDanielle]|uniref:Uncharacterized protein n=1 Tax=Hafnia phage vB_HpaM_SarahDanielle TaxID=2836113 RepID=A0AAE7W9G9_9CAUD|nr:hypothetical protein SARAHDANIELLE_76 [Hafnia phage vB_HpaM_SarahDanielle]